MTARLVASIECKQMCWRPILSAAFSCLPTIAASQAAFEVITPVRVEASSTFFTYREANLINNSGLSSGRHDSLYTGMWLNDQDGATGTITFDLGRIYSLVSVDVWQYSFVPARGVRGLSILSSQDGLDYRLLKLGRLEAVSESGPSREQTVPIEAAARFVRFVITSNWGDSEYTGLAEVKFRTVPGY
jgi:hypothetical protein